MNANEVLRIVDAIHRDKNIDKEIVFQAIEAALVSAAKKQYGEDQDIVVHIDRKDGAISGTHNGVPLDPEETDGPHRRPNRQASHHPENPRGRARRPVRRIPRARSAR